MGRPACTLERRYSYGDYRQWLDEECWELWDGIPRAMSPAPGQAHQTLVVEIIYQFRSQMEGLKCRGFVAPLDVLLPEGEEADDCVRTVVQPDVLVVCSPEKLTPRGCRGAPDLVVEVASPSSAAADLRGKLEIYEKHGVPEYWVVLPEARVLFQFLREPDGRYSRPLVWGGRRHRQGRRGGGTQPQPDRHFPTAGEQVGPFELLPAQFSVPWLGSQ